MAHDQTLKVLMLDAAASSVQVTHNLCNHLGQSGCDVHVFTAPRWMRSADSCSRSFYQKRITFYAHTQIRSYEARTAASRLFWRILRLAQHARAMFAICSMAREFDVVHVQILPVPALDYLYLRMIAKHTPIVFTVHELVPHSARFRGLTGRILKASYHLASILFVYTDYTRKRLINEQGVAPDKVQIIPHGNLEHLLELKSDSRPISGEQPPIILFIGNIRRDKGLDVLIQAARHLRKKVSNFKIQIAGTPGFDLTAIQNSVVELGLQDFVEWRLGFLQEREFASYLNGATIVVLPYLRAEQSGVAVAACTFGKAIVASRCGGVAELVTEAGNGLLVPVNDPGALADALAELLLDKEKRELFEQRSASYACGALSWGPIASKTVSAYKTAVKAAAS